jgi:hypothetical protein
MASRPGARGVVQRRLGAVDPPTEPSFPSRVVPTQGPIVVPPPSVPPVADDPGRGLRERQRRWLRSSAGFDPRESSASAPGGSPISEPPGKGAKG